MQVLDHPSEVSFSPMLRRYTLEEFWALPEPGDRSHYDLIEGVLFIVPPADYPHDGIDARLNKSLVLFLVGEGIQGDVHHPQAAIYRDVEAGTYLEPDMMYVSPDLKERMGKNHLRLISFSSILRRARPTTIAPPRPIPIWLWELASFG